MNLEELKVKLKTYKKEDIKVTPHAEMQAYVRQIDINEVKENITNPEKLVYFKEQEDGKYDCYFAFSDILYHRYILTINAKIIIVTIIKVNRRWQHLIEKGNERF
jgi:hypothetical protein